jgi:hypothetical protein
MTHANKRYVAQKTPNAEEPDAGGAPEMARCSRQAVFLSTFHRDDAKEAGAGDSQQQSR